jgi:hypothetical protein
MAEKQDNKFNTRYVLPTLLKISAILVEMLIDKHFRIDIGIANIQTKPFHFS